jgi:hypothetical protein
MKHDEATVTPAPLGQVERGVRALDPERAAFEAWWCKACHPATLVRQEAGCYLNRDAGLAWDAWQAARPKRAAVGAIVNVAADLAQRKPLRALDPLTEVSHIGHRQMARAYAQADEDTRLLAVKLADAVRAL